MEAFAKLRATLARHRRPLLCGALLAAALLVSGVTGLGAYLDERLYLMPVLKLRQQVGLAPKPHPDLRLVLFEDRALKRVGRTATFREWYEVARLLRAEGFERILVLGIHAETPDALPEDAGALLVHGVADTPDGANLRAVPAASLPRSLLLPAPGAAALVEPSRFLLAPARNAFPYLAGVGLMNLLDDLTVPAARAAGPDALVPHIGLLAAGDLRMAGDHLEAAGVPVPVTPDGRLYVDYMDYRDAVAKAVGASSLYTRDYSGIASTVGDNARALLAGGRVALVVPDAWTGTRFVESPSGMVPAFIAAASIANSALTGQWLSVPFRPTLVVVLWSLLLVAAAALAGRALDAVASAAALLAAAGAVAALLAGGYILPAAQLVLAAAAVAAVGFADRYLHAFREKVLLRNDLNIGSVVQTTLFPSDTALAFGPWQARVTFRPHGPMSGDWYLTYRSPEGAPRPLCIIALGDVVGKGPGAALCTAMIASVWLAQRERWDAGDFDLDDLARRVNRTIFEAFGGQQNTTLSIAVLGEDEIRVVAYGAPRWLRFTPELTAVTARLRPNDPLGMTRQLTPQTPAVWRGADLAGCCFVGYTDGVVDGQAPRARVLRALARGGAVADPMAAIEREMLAAARENPLADDVTLVVVHHAAGTGGKVAA